MECREQCGACCIAPGISQPFYGMPNGKPAGVACIHLDRQMRCQLFGDPRRPPVCASFAPEPAFCGDTREQAIRIMLELEGIDPDSAQGS
ncbi:YkgJ family cysteine cluster protein [Reinekea sp. G2M2-21]|uniref:YkgJ family cysteine cluster protein n=1 Tax=Reinekea sp. G2M2-21 TaxID=2788942 RepID=UPI001E3332B4|nr:YkgJ family cysteine cluster protein [Reinekea sp. G2M2-21]